MRNRKKIFQKDVKNVTKIKSENRLAFYKKNDIFPVHSIQNKEVDNH